MIIENVTAKMIRAFEHTIPSEIEHATQVLENAKAIMLGEGVEGRDFELISITALLHDIGMIDAQEKYGSTAGPYQEKEGPSAARALLVDEEITETEIQRICHIIGHHHTPSMIDGMDFQILWEADVLEALKKITHQLDGLQLAELMEKNFKTMSGRELASNKLSMNSLEKTTSSNGGI